MTEDKPETPAKTSLRAGRKGRIKRWTQTHRVELLLFFLLWTTYAYFYQSTQHNEAARFDQARAIFQDHTLLINKYWWNTADVIHFTRDGVDHIYPAKAPGMSMVALPPFVFFFLVLKIFRPLGLPEWIYWHFVTYLSIVFSVGLLSALAGVATYRLLRRVTADSYLSAFVVIAIWLGTILFPFSTVFFSHALSAALLAFAFYFLFKLRLGGAAPSLRRVYAQWLCAGFFLGFSATNEYPTAILAACISFYGLWSLTKSKLPVRAKKIIFGFWVFGGMIGGALLIGYNLLAFGKPFYLAYEALSQPNSPFQTHTHGWIGFQWPGFGHFLHAVASFMLFPPVGLLYLKVEKWGVYACNPVLWLALPGLVIMIWKTRWRAEATLIVAMTTAYILFISCYGTSIYDWAGASYLGPRHLIPLLPFWALPLYFGARYLRFVFYPLLTICVFYMLLATATEPRVPFPTEVPARDLFLPDYIDGKFAQNTLNLFDAENRNLTRDSTAFNLAKLAGWPGRYQLAPLMAWWFVLGGVLFQFASRQQSAKSRESDADETMPAEAPPRVSAYSPNVAVVVLFLFVSAITIAPVVHYAQRYTLHATHGLLGKYYRNEKWAAEPVDVKIDPVINFNWAKSWPFPPPFSVDWTGQLIVERPGAYTFTLVADDGALVEIDGNVVVDVSKGPILVEQNGMINLNEGSHRIRVRYFNVLFGGSVKLSWAPPGRPREVVPNDALIPDQP